MKIAAILTVHNRKEKTLNCLSRLISICPEVDIYLTDDGSTDGTSEEIKARFPKVSIQKGDGHLFWNRGMLLSWEVARKENYDYYLWLNDDTLLYPNFLEELFACQQMISKPCIVSGLIEDLETKKIIYGGSSEQKVLISSSTTPQRIHSLNGNVVLIPKEVVDTIGILDPRLHHDLGDVDYGFRCKQAGFGVYSTRKAVAAGWINDYCRIRKWGTTISKRFKRLYSPLGSPPAITFYFRKKHFGVIHAISFLLYIFTLNVLPDSIVKYCFGKRYSH